MKTGMQFYSLSGMVNGGQFEQALAIAASSGVDGIEVYDYYDVPAMVYRKAFNNTGIVCYGAHVSLASLRSNLDRVMEYNYVLGNPTIICPYLVQDDRGTKEKWLAAAATLNEIAAKLKRNGFNFLYHNHDFEFHETFDGMNGMDLLLANTDDQLVGIQLHIGQLPKFNIIETEYIKKLGRRIKILHVHAFLTNPDDTYDSAPSIKAARELDIEWAVLENVYPLPVDTELLKGHITALRVMAQG